VKLLLDNNLSPRLVARMTDVLPDAQHVSLLGLEQASDATIWEHARTHGFTIVTKDSDFNDLLVVQGPPPKVVWLRMGNCTTAQLELVVRSSLEKIDAFIADPTIGLLTLL
jgi:predicted nuclease of predicted toxin-antitoxin system